MPHFVVEKIADALNVRRKPINGSSILVAGVAYKRDIDDIRESPSLDVMTLLQAKGARVSYADPHVPTLGRSAWPGAVALESVELTAGTVAEFDCVAILTDHRAFDYEMLVRTADVIVDTRNAIRTRHPHVFRLGASSSDDTAAADMAPAA